MKVIIPLAGKGTRLRPHTHLVPKPMLKIAGKPVMAYILEDLERLGGVDQVIYVTRDTHKKIVLGAGGHQRVVAGIAATPDRPRADRGLHLRVDDLVDASRGVLNA